MGCRRFSIVSFFSFLLLVAITFPAIADEAKINPEQSNFTLEVTDNLINLQAEEASFKDILNELERKAGIKVEIFDGVDNKKVTFALDAEWRQNRELWEEAKHDRG